MKNWDDYLDQAGLVTQKQSLGGDGGDSLNRTCAYIVLANWTWKTILQIADAQVANAMVYRHLEKSPGRYRRSPHAGKWYSATDRTSRDQLIPLVILLGIASKQKLKAVFKDHLKRGLLFAYNTRRNFQYPTLEEHLEKSTPDVKWNYSWKVPDFTGPDFWALYIRGFNLWWLRGFLELMDMETLLNAIIIRLSPKRDDVINHALILEYSRIRLPTFVSSLARRITSRSLLQSRLDQFFTKEIEPPLNDLYRNLG